MSDERDDVLRTAHTLQCMNATDCTRSNDALLALTEQFDHGMYWIVINRLSSDTAGWVMMNTEHIAMDCVYLLHDILSHTVYIKHGDELARKGLFVSLNGYAAHVFKVRAVDNTHGLAGMVTSILGSVNVPSTVVDSTGSEHLEDMFNDPAVVTRTVLNRIDVGFFSSEDGKQVGCREYSNKPFDTLYLRQGTKEFLIVLNTTTTPSSGFVKQKHFSVETDAPHTLFFVFEDVLTNMVYIRRADALASQGLFIALDAGKSHFFRIKKVCDTHTGLLNMLCEQLQGKGLASDEKWHTLFEQDQNIVSFSLYEQHLCPTQDHGVWIEQHYRNLVGKTIVYMTMEMFVPELYQKKDGTRDSDAVDATFTGGLGILAGCTMEGFVGIGLDVCAIVPLYHQRRIQQLGNDKGQLITHRDVAYDQYKNLSRLLDPTTKKPLDIRVYADGKEHTVAVYTIRRGGAPVYFLYCPEVFDVIYIGDRKQRLIQEIVVGKVAPELLRRCSIKPDIVHLNEAHCVLSAVNMKTWKQQHGGDTFFDDTRILFTIHTPRAAGMEIYYFPYNALEIPSGYETIFDREKRGCMDFTSAAMELADRVNTVSDNQIRVVNERLFSDDRYRKKMIGILNGTSSSYWVSDRMKPKMHDDIATLDVCELWQIHTQDKKIIADDFAAMMKEQRVAKLLGIPENALRLDPNKPLATAMRRIVDYKQQWPMLKDIIRVVCAPRTTHVVTPFGTFAGLGMQLILGGMAHPNDKQSQEWIREFVMWMGGKWRDAFDKPYTDTPELVGNFFFLPASEKGLGVSLKMAAMAGDVCLEFPLWDEEACGTSGMRALSNANPCIESSDGALEWLTEGTGGWFLKPYSAQRFLECLELASRHYYHFFEHKDTASYPWEHDPWLVMRKNAFIAWREIASITRMSQRYAAEMFYPTIAAKHINNVEI